MIKQMKLLCYMGVNQIEVVLIHIQAILYEYMYICIYVYMYMEYNINMNAQDLWKSIGLSLSLLTINKALSCSLIVLVKFKGRFKT